MASLFPQSCPAAKLLVITELMTASPTDSSNPESQTATLIPAFFASLTGLTRALSSRGARAMPSTP